MAEELKALTALRERRAARSNAAAALLTSLLRRYHRRVGEIDAAWQASLERQRLRREAARRRFDAR